MGKIKVLFSKLGQSISKTIRRFPRSIVLAALFGVVFIVLNHINVSADTEEILNRVALSLLFAIPLCMIMQLYFEMHKSKSALLKAMMWVLAAAACALCYFVILKDLNTQEYIIRYAVMLASCSLYFTIVTFIKRRNNPEVYATKLAWRLIITVIYNWIIVGGITAVLFAIENLLKVDITEKLYFDVILFVPTFIMPAFFLAGIPSVQEEIGDKINKLLKTLLLYVGMTILTAYTVVLYIYFLKLLINSEWPVNMLGNLVLWYGIISIVVLYTANTTKRDNAWSRFFYRIYPFLLILPVIMMFVSFGIRIRAYGVTEPRYAALVIGVWILCSAILFLKKDMTKRIKFIPLILVMVCLISVLGPWSMFGVSKQSQNSRFVAVLTKHNMILDGKIVPNDELPQEDKEILSSVIEYFEDNHELSDVKYLPDGFKKEDSMEVLGFDYQAKDRYNNDGMRYYFVDHSDDNMVDVNGYQYYITSPSNDEMIETAEGKLQITLDDVNNLTVSLNEEEIYVQNVEKHLNKLYKKYPEGQSLPREELVIIDSNEKLGIKILLNHITHDLDGEKSRITYNVLINIKDGK